MEPVARLNTSRSGAGSTVNETLVIDRDLLEWALARIGDESGGCPFEPIRPDDPDHHGPEFADALFAAIRVEIAEYDTIKAAVKK